jgi:formate dehydrogenase iron-sulfur subunit
MKFSRRSFFKTAIGSAGTALVLSTASETHAVSEKEASPDWYGCLMDTTLCVGCRKCEAACNESNKLPPPEKSFEDKSVLVTPRRPSSSAFTVVNQYKPEEAKDPVFTKVQCMHCNDPACVSACIVGALKKDETGAVTYNADKCIGCRYCMVACPFQVPGYEYRNALAPRVRKCELCIQKIHETGSVPSCVKICPKESITFGKREDLLRLAKEKIAGNGTENRPHAKYIDHIYGAEEVGGTGWLYLSSVPFEQIGFLKLPKEAPPRLTEKIQHSIFKDFVPQMALFSFLGFAMHTFKGDRDRSDDRDIEV